MFGKNKRGNHSKDPFGDRAADKITEIIGSWKFIIIQSILLFLWVAVNIVAWMSHWDPYPFILLNLALSFQAAYAAPIIMMSQNRVADRDRKKWEQDLATDRRAERRIIELQKQLNGIERNKLARICQAVEKNNR
ncbi:MAG: DUF1003 domain-containing protein, partial [Candidatus Moranbacteria bacterium]|nr:DUF1003 domain-containing protein [Candidatus Moranbacteria bacterium]